MAPCPQPAPAATTDPRSSCLVVVDGVVQGVGFRPFVWRLASELGLTGSVRNTGGGVEIEVAGDAAALRALVARLRTDAPAPARVDTVAVAVADPGTLDATGFTIAESVAATTDERLFPPDLAACPDCLREVADPTDRRYRYPFTNCTRCGPRATIIDDLPYDRSATTMRGFSMCPQCAAEYADPANRRFHAEPVACPACGPRLVHVPATADGAPAGDGAPGSERDHHRDEGDDRTVGEEALGRAVADLRAGRIVAVKGLGGYHLACDATDEDAVRRLRERKRRWAKPLAVMVADVAAAERLAWVQPLERTLLASPAAPIVLLASRPRPQPAVAPSVTAGNPRVGVLLPYTPLHHLLLAGVGRPIVLTSGNLSDEPLATDDDDALRRLSGVADAFLAHDRPIRARYDDTVTRVVAGRESVIRRGRGYAPQPVPLPVAARQPILAVGAELKHTFSIARGALAHVAPHNGDLEDLPTHEAFTEGLAHLQRLLAVKPDVVAHDRHPEYLSTKYALARFPVERRVAVQHHHAHVASCAAEHGIDGPFIGVAYDGLGMGDDGTLWGGEVLAADLTGYRRLGRFGRAPLPGGALAVRRPYRMALGYLLGAEDVGGRPDGTGRTGSGSPGGPDRPSGPWIEPEAVAGFLAGLDEREVAMVRTQVARGLNAPVASSAGRLFDAAAALRGLRGVAEYEAQAAVDLETAAGERRATALPFRLAPVDGMLVYDPRPTLTALCHGVARGRDVGDLAAAFHETVVEVTRELVAAARATTGLEVVCLSGGVLQNARLAAALLARLAADDLDVRINRAIPCNDGGISYGQAAVAAATITAAGGRVPSGPAARA